MLVIAVAGATVVSPRVVEAQASSQAKSKASEAAASKAAAEAARKKAAEDAAKAEAAKKATEEAAAAAKAAAAAAEAQRLAAEKLKADQEAAAADLASRQAAALAEKERQEAIKKAAEDEAVRLSAERAAAEAAAAKAAAEAAEAEKIAAQQAALAAAEAERQAALRALAEAEAAKIRGAEEAALREAAERANSDKEKAKAAAELLRLEKEKHENSVQASENAHAGAQAESDAARSAAQQSEAEAQRASEAAQRAADRALKAEEAENRYNNALNDTERNSAMQDLNDATIGAGEEADRARGHANNADSESTKAKDHADNAQRKFDDLPPPTPPVQAVITSRSWMLCGGSYNGWSGPGLCAAATLDAVADQTSGLATITMKIRNLSGLFRSYAGSVLTGIGLTNILGQNANGLSAQGACAPADQDCASQWELATGNHAHMPNGIGLVDLKIMTRGITGGIASTCAADIRPPQIDQNGQPVEVPANPNGLFTTNCFGTDWITYTFMTSAPVDFTYTELSLRAQNGYPNGSGSTACIYSGDQSDAQNACSLIDGNTQVTPEPATTALLGTGLMGLLGAARRRRKRNSAAAVGADSPGA